MKRVLRSWLPHGTGSNVACKVHCRLLITQRGSDGRCQPVSSRSMSRRSGPAASGPAQSFAGTHVTEPFSLKRGRVWKSPDAIQKEFLGYNRTVLLDMKKKARSAGMAMGKRGDKWNSTKQARWWERFE